LQLVVDVFGIELGVAGGTGQGHDERYPGREIPARSQGLAHHRGLVAYGGNLGQVLVVGVPQHLLFQVI
jgi:hypothetical protein